MTTPEQKKAETNKDPNVDSQIDTPHYDRGIVPAEIAARKEREGDAFMTTPDEVEGSGVDTTKGYTVDQEGLVNNFAIEPEMYIDEPGDLREKNEQLKEERRQQLQDLQTTSAGDLSPEGDDRTKGQGLL